MNFCIKYKNTFFSSLLSIISELECKRYEEFIIEINLFLRISKEKDILDLIQKNFEIFGYYREMKENGLNSKISIIQIYFRNYFFV